MYVTCICRKLLVLLALILYMSLFLLFLFIYFLLSLFVLFFCLFSLFSSYILITLLYWFYRTILWANVVSKLSHRLRRWPNIKSTLARAHTNSICAIPATREKSNQPVSVWWRASVVDAGRHHTNTASMVSICRDAIWGGFDLWPAQTDAWVN